MKSRLEDYTMGELIDLMCREEVTDPECANALRDVVLQFKEIADPAGFKSFLSSMEDELKAKMEVQLFTVCQNLVKLGEFGRVREIMDEYGVAVDGMGEERVKAEIDSRLERAKSVLDKIGQEQVERSTSHDIRKEFDAQTAALMAYFKFQIDTSTMRATVYAHLIARYNREIKALQAKR